MFSSFSGWRDLRNLVLRSQLKNGPDIYSPPLGSHGGNGHFCGSRPSSTMFTSDNQMFVQFISDDSNGGRGFKIKYEAKGLGKCFY